MAPHAITTILQTPQWPLALSDFVTWCLMWDPKNRPTSLQAMNHEYFADAVDPLMRPRSNRLLGRRQQQVAPESKTSSDMAEGPALQKRASWFRKSLIGRDNLPSTLPTQQPQQQQPANPQLASPRPSPVHHANSHPIPPVSPKLRPNAVKRTTWANGTTAGAPMPILPSIRPISPLSNAVTAEARSTNHANAEGQAPQPAPADMPTPEKKKLGRQLSLASNGNHYADRESGGSGLASPTSGQKESFFSHLRKRARRFSGRNHLVASPRSDDVEANNPALDATRRGSMAVDPAPIEPQAPRGDFTELDRALQNVRYSLNTSSQPHLPLQYGPPPPVPVAPTAPTARQYAPVGIPTPRGSDDWAAPAPAAGTATPGVARSSSHARRTVQLSTNQSFRYETPDEEEELLDEALHGVSRAMHRLDGRPSKKRSVDLEGHRQALGHRDLNRAHHHQAVHHQHHQHHQPQPHYAMAPHSLHHAASGGVIHSTVNAAAYPNPYPTPSPSAKRSGMLYNDVLLAEPATPIAINRPRKESHNPAWPTPPYEDNDAWASSAAAQIFAAGSTYR